MNLQNTSHLLLRLVHRYQIYRRRLLPRQQCKAFASHCDGSTARIQGIWVINLDRQQKRWHLMQRELRRVCDYKGHSLLKITERFPAFDALGGHTPNPLEVDRWYTLRDQLLVEPQPDLAAPEIVGEDAIEMSPQETAVASSHIAVWKAIATGSHSHVLVLEDDAYFAPRFAPVLEQTWTNLFHTIALSGKMDCLYLSYQEAKGGANKEHVSEFLFRPRRGLWNLSGYVLSAMGARKLLDLLPVRGPVDLWMNQQFSKLNVYATSDSLIQQRLDVRSDNAYSVLPVLSKRGILTKERPALFPRRRLVAPVFAMGDANTGLTSLAMALSMLGYRCISDLDRLPPPEHRKLLRGSKSRVFDAYVNIASLNDEYYRLPSLYPRGRVIVTVANATASAERCDMLDLKGRAKPYWSTDGDELQVPRNGARRFQRSSTPVLFLSANDPNRWQSLCSFLKCNPPACPYPTLADRRERVLGTTSRTPAHVRSRRLAFDKSPWIAPRRRGWQGVPLEDSTAGRPDDVQELSVGSRPWRLLDDTFPSNLALFRPANFSLLGGDTAVLTARKEGVHLRDYTSASVRSRRPHHYGRFEARIRPAGVSGLITGMFLHRNSPRQEIDMEFLGKDPTRLLVNVFYNPGEDGARFDYGYRGTPVLVDLGFDAARGFHDYALEWCPTSIRWYVDGHVVHERANWDPTPIPHLPMRFHINLWPSRSRELAGRLADEDLPAHAEIKSVKCTGVRWSWPRERCDTGVNGGRKCDTCGG